MTHLKTLTAITLALIASLAAGQQSNSVNNANALTAQAAPAYTFKAKRLDRAELDVLLSKPDQTLVVDVRRPDELTKIGGFPVYLSIQLKELENGVAFIPKDRTIVTVSNHAWRAGAAADLLTSKGFKVAGAVGVQDYEAQGGRLTKIAPPAPKPADANTSTQKKTL